MKRKATLTQDQMEFIRRFADSMNRRMEVTFAMCVPLVQWLTDQMDDLERSIPYGDPFLQRMKNRVRAVARECDAFNALTESLMDTDDRRESYVGICDAFAQGIEQWTKSIVRREYGPSYELRRRAMMRYRDPYDVDTAARNEAFNDGYCKGWQDCALENMRSARECEDSGHDTVMMAVDGMGNTHVKPGGAAGS